MKRYNVRKFNGKTYYETNNLNEAIKFCIEKGNCFVVDNLSENLIYIA